LEKFKQLREKSHQAMDLHKLYLRAGEREKAKQHRGLNTILFEIFPSVKKTESVIREVNKAMRLISASKNLENSEKARRMRKLKERKIDSMRRTHSRFVNIVDPV
jgi:hypothetical protein